MDESTGNLSDLPVNYTYCEVCKTADEWTFRIKEIKDKESAEEWLNEYSEVSKTTWRVARTYTNGRCNVLKKDYRCVHNTDRRARGMRPSKHTGCEAKLEIVVRRFIKNPKNQVILDETHPCIVKIKKKHNHAVNSAEALKYRDLCPSVKQKFIDLFNRGHNPASALKCHKKDLMIEKGEEYFQAAADGKVMPSYSIVAKLFEREFSKTYGVVSVEDFEVWKEDTGKLTKSSYVKTCTKHLSASNVNAVCYACHRSGFYVPNSVGKRKYITSGSRKINASCPSSTEVKRNESGVQFWKTHFGHDYDTAPLPKEKLTNKTCDNLEDDAREMMEITEENEISDDSFVDECEVYSDDKESVKISHEDGLKSLETALSYVQQQDDATPADILMLTRLRNLAAKKIGSSMKPKAIKIFFYESLKR